MSYDCYVSYIYPELDFVVIIVIRFTINQLTIWYSFLVLSVIVF